MLRFKFWLVEEARPQSMTDTGVAPNQCPNMTSRPMPEEANAVSGVLCPRRNRRRRNQPRQKTSGMLNSTFTKETTTHEGPSQHQPELEHAMYAAGAEENFEDRTADQSVLAQHIFVGSDCHPEDDTVRSGIAITPQDRKTVAIFADYDGCFDIISRSNLAGAKMDKMFDYAKQINRLLYPRRHAEKMLTDFLDKITADAGQVLLFSGSNRQSRKADESNAVQNDNGLAMTGLKGLAEDKGWQFKSILLEDAAKNPKEIMSVVGGSSEIKRMLAENNFTCLTGPTDVYFFDDIEKYLKYTREKANIPENIELKTVHFDWYGICIDGTQDGDRPLTPISARESNKQGKM